MDGIRYSVIVLALIVFTLTISLYISSDDRHWQAYIDAGNAALGRGNYEWTDKMYRQALRHAQLHGNNNRLIVRTKAHIRRLDKIRNP